MTKLPISNDQVNRNWAMTKAGLRFRIEGRCGVCGRGAGVIVPQRCEARAPSMAPEGRRAPQGGRGRWCSNVIVFYFRLTTKTEEEQRPEAVLSGCSGRMPLPLTLTAFSEQTLATGGDNVNIKRWKTSMNDELNTWRAHERNERTNGFTVFIGEASLNS